MKDILRRKFNSKPDIDIPIDHRPRRSSLRNNFSPSELSFPEDAKAD